MPTAVLVATVRRFRFVAMCLGRGLLDLVMVVNDDCVHVVMKHVCARAEAK